MLVIYSTCTAENRYQLMGCCEGVIDPVHGPWLACSGTCLALDAMVLRSLLPASRLFTIWIGFGNHTQLRRISSRVPHNHPKSSE